MTRRKPDEKRIATAETIVELGVLNDALYNISEQIGEILKALPRQRQGKDFEETRRVLVALLKAQALMVTRLVDLAQSLEEEPSTVPPTPQPH